MEKKKRELTSVYGRRCLTKCYPKNTNYLHPVLLTTIKSTQNSCAVQPIYAERPDDKNVQMGNMNMLITDKCRLEDNEEAGPPSDLGIILLGYHFSAYDFLTKIYDLHSFREVISWTQDHPHIPGRTRVRIHECAWRVFGRDPEGLEQSVLEYYYHFIREKWLPDYVREIVQNYALDLELPPGEKLEEQVLHILRKQFTRPFFIDSIKNFIQKNWDIWNEIQDYGTQIKNFLQEQLIVRLTGK
jgi:hypothetical protein